jgi:hypothetical protein
MAEYTDKELLDYMATQKPGSFITAAELQFGFGGDSQYHAGRLRKLVNAGKLEKLSGKTRGRGSRYALAKRRNPLADHSAMARNHWGEPVSGGRYKFDDIDQANYFREEINRLGVRTEGPKPGKGRDEWLVRVYPVKNPRYSWQTPSSYIPGKGRGPVHECNVCGECDYTPGPRACGALVAVLSTDSSLPNWKRNDHCRLPHHHPGDHEGRHKKENPSSLDDTEELSEIFDSLKPKETILVAMKSVMGMSRVTDGNYHEWKVGRRSYSKKYGVTTITLLPMDGSKPNKFNRFALRKRRDKVSASHGDMGVMLIGVKRPNPWI